MTQFSKNPLPIPHQPEKAWRPGWIVLILIMITLVACKSNSWFNKADSKLKVDKETVVKSTAVSTSESRTFFTRKLSDSSGYDYQVTIIPLDTIRFSTENGFTGLASRVYISGNSSQFITIIDSASGTNEIENQHKEEIASATELLQKENAKTRHKEISLNRYFPLLLIALIITVMLTNWIVKRKGLN